MEKKAEIVRARATSGGVGGETMLPLAARGWRETSGEATFERGIAKVGPGEWLVGKEQPLAYGGERRLQVRAIRGAFAPDRFKLRQVAGAEVLYCGLAERPFLTRLDCPVPVQVVSDKVLLAPAAARTGALLVRLIPLSFRFALCTTVFQQQWVVAATRSRTMQKTLAEGETLTVSREAVVAWTTKRPTSFLPRLRLRDILLPAVQPKRLMLTFYGPGVLWFEGA